MTVFKKCLNEGCNNQVADHKNAKFCSRTCACQHTNKPANIRLYKHTCSYCTKVFETSKPRSKYCSSICRSTAYNKQKALSRKNGQPKPGIDNGVTIGLYEAISEKTLRYEHTRNEIIEQSRQTMQEPHRQIQISPRTWVVARPQSESEAEIIRQKTIAALEKNKAAF